RAEIRTLVPSPAASAAGADGVLCFVPGAGTPPRGGPTARKRAGPVRQRRRARLVDPPTVATDVSAESADLREPHASITAVTDRTALRSRIATLTEESAAPGLWDDPDGAQADTSRLSHAQHDLERIEQLGSRIDDLEVMVELGDE